MSDLAAHAAGTVWQWRRRASSGEEARRRAAAATRKRGLVGLAVGLAVAGAFAWYGNRTMAIVVAAIAGTLALLALLSPLGAYPYVGRLLERFGRLVGVTLTWILMTLVYLLLFLPVGLLLRATGKLRLQRAYDARRASYWQPVPERSPGLDRYRRQF
jgi:hypothetical protein